MTEKKRKAAPRQTAKPARTGAPQAERQRGLLVYWPRLLFAIPVLVIMSVPFYNRAEPSLGGVPFFYWYQLAWILIGAAIVLIVYLLETRMTRVLQRAGASVDPGATGDVL